MRNIEQYNICSPFEYFDAISLPDEPPVEAVYYLLQKRLRRALQHVFELHGFGLSDSFEDTIDDFFLYLYEGNDGDGKPFSVINSIQKKEAFFGWIIATYRNFLMDKTKEEFRRKALLEQARLKNQGEEKGLSEDTMISYLASAIAYADQCFKPCNLFILYRLMLTLLDHSRAIPQDEMARAMQLHPVTYRVRCKRQRDNFQKYIMSQELGHHLNLDRQHELMRLCIEEEFYRLYDLLIGYYNHVLGQLPVKSSIRALRLKYRQEMGIVMHEGNHYGYRFNMQVEALYKALKS